MTPTYKYKSKAANAIVFIAGLITYIGKDMLAQVMPKELAYLAPVIVMIAGYITVQTTENTRVVVAEQKAIEDYEAKLNETVDPAAEYPDINTNDAVGDEDGY